MIALFALVALLGMLGSRSSSRSSSSGPLAPKSTTWAGGAVVDDGRDVDPAPPPPPPPAVDDNIPTLETSWVRQGTAWVDNLNFTMPKWQRARLALPKLDDGDYTVRVVVSAVSGTQLCFDVRFSLRIRNGLPVVTRSDAGYIVLDPSSVGACKMGTNIGPVGTYRIGEYRYAAVNRTGYQGRGPAYAVDVVLSGAGAIAVELRCARDWRQHLLVTLAVESA